MLGNRLGKLIEGSGRKSYRSRRKTTFNGGDEFGGTNRFGEVGIHSSAEATLLIFLESVCGHGDDGDVAACRLFFCANGGGGFEAVHNRHLNVHQN